MPPSRVPCPGCGTPIRTTSRYCWTCTTAKRKQDAADNFAAKFEPQSIPIADAEWAGRPFDDPRNNFRKEPWNRGVPLRDTIASPIRVAVLDIETTGLDASFGRVLCGVTQFFSPDETRIRRADQHDEWNTGRRASDAELVTAILKDVEEADIVIAHNGNQFDLPFLRTRALIHGLPPVHPKKIIDPVLLARKTFRFHSNSLDSISMVMGTSDAKTRLSPRTWVAAMFNGDKDALEEIIEHCVADVRVLCEVARRVSPYIRQVDQIGSWR